MAPDAPPDPFDGFALTLARAAAPLAPRPATMAMLRARSDVAMLPKGAALLRLEDVAAHVFFVLAGVLRTTHLAEGTGEERTAQFFDEGAIFTDPASFFGRLPARQGIEAVLPARVLRLPRDALLAAYDEDHAVERFGRLMVEEALRGSQRRSANLLTLSPEDRYRAFLDARPGLARRLPQYLIASYLGITPEALSRIRRRLVRP